MHACMHACLSVRLSVSLFQCVHAGMCASESLVCVVHVHVCVNKIVLRQETAWFQLFGISCFNGTENNNHNDDDPQSKSLERKRVMHSS